MMMKKFLLTIGLISLLILSSQYTAVAASETADSVGINDPSDLLSVVPHFDKKIAIIYSSNDQQVADIAGGINQFISPFYQPVDLFKISSLVDITHLDPDYWIVIHVYDTTTKGPLIGGNQASWSNLAGYINSNPNTQHILAISNTKQATIGLGGAINHASLVDNQTEVTDGKLVAVNAVWLTGNYIANHAPDSRYLEVADQIRGLVVKYFAENINEMVERSYDPPNPMGQIDTTAQQERFDTLIQKSPKTANYISPNGVSIPLIQAVQAELVDKNQYGIVVNSFENDLTIAQIPTKSGIEGPAGKVLDTLLGILVNYIKYVELSPDVANQITEIMKYIPKILGIINDPSVENILSIALDIIIQRFPGFKEYRKYIEIALEGFYSLREGPEAIIAFALNLVKEFFPPDSGIITLAEQILNDDLLELIDKISRGENIFQAVLSWISNIVLDTFLQRIFENWLGFDLSSSLNQLGGLNLLATQTTQASSTEPNFINRIKNALSSVFKTALGLFQSQDTSDFISNDVPDLIFADLIPNLYPLIGKTIVVDPGHGGVHSGTSGTLDGVVYREQDFNLNVSLYLRGYLEAAGATVLMTRENDTELDTNLGRDLRARAALANDPNGDGVDEYADAFVSVHFNSNNEPTVKGTYGLYDINNAYGSTLADYLRNGIISELNTRRISTQSVNGSLSVLRNTPNLPHSIIEVAFMSNQEDLKMFSFPANRSRAALGISNGLINYFADGHGRQPNNPRIVMIPGWGGDPTAFDVMIPILESKGIEIIDFNDTLPGTQALRYDATLDGGDLDTAALANQVEEMINARTEPGEKVNIIAYSYGGIIARYLIEAGPSDPNIDDTWAARVDKLFMHGTPNHGTTVAYIGAINLLNDDWARSAEDMEPNSPLLNALGYSEPIGEEYITFGGNPSYLSNFDGVVSTSSPQLDGAVHHIINGHHRELVTLPNVIDIIFNELGYGNQNAGTSLNLYGDAVSIQLEYFNVIADHEFGSDEEYFFDVYVNRDGENEDFELLDTFEHSEDGPFTWSPGEGGPVSVSFQLLGTSPRFDVKVVAREDDTVINIFYFNNIMFSEDIDGVKYYSYEAPDPSGDGNNELRISTSGFTSDPSKLYLVTSQSSQFTLYQTTGTPLKIATDAVNNGIGFNLDQFKPFIEIGKIIYWIGSKLGGIRDSKDFLNNFPIAETIDKLFEAVHIATGNEYRTAQAEIKEYAELVKAVLNGTITSVDIASTAIDHIVDSLSSLNKEYQDFIGKVLKFIVGRIAENGSPLRQIVQDTLEQFIQEGLQLFFSNLSPVTRESIEKIMNFIIPGAVTILAVLKESPALASIIASSGGMTPEQALEQARTKAIGYLADLTGEIINHIPTSFLNETQKGRLNLIVGELPKFVIMLISSSFESETSFTGIIRQLGLFTINIVMEKIRTALKEHGINDFAVYYFLQMAESVFEGLVEDKFNVDLPSIEQVIKDLTPYLLDKVKSVVSPETYQIVEFFIKALPSAILFFEDGIGWLISELKRWIATILTDLLNDLLGKLNDLFAQYSFFSIGGEMPIGLGPFVLFEFTYQFDITANLEFDRNGLRDFIISLLLDGNRILTDFDASSIIKKVLSFLHIAPVIAGNFGIKQLATSESGIFQVLLALLGFNIEFSGFAYFSILLFQLGANGFDSKSFLKVLAWGLEISILIYKKITILDLFTGGLGGGFISKLASYIGLDLISIIIKFGINLKILMRADTPTESASGIAILSFLIEAGLSISIGIDLFIVGAKLSFYAGIRLILTFDQDFLRREQPLRIIFRILIILQAKLKVKLLFKTKTIWSARVVLEPFGPFDLSPKKRSDVISSGGMGYDDDYDGIPDEYERRFPGLNVGNFGEISANSLSDSSKMITSTFNSRSSVDTDGDGLTDKQELKFILTDPTVPDTDGDGLIDSVEVNIFSNPLKKDTDYDGLTDGEEVLKYGTDPLNSDTDEDGLTDQFEINHSWNMTGITPSVTEVIIGGVVYHDRTDPLNPDTDGDLLLDGQEGELGPYYGGDLPYDPYFDTEDLVWNGGYTHPLDNDTDDDSYMQAYDGQILPSKIYLGDMRDGVEVRGINAIVLENGDYVSRTFYTDPTRSDSDGDTGPGGEGVILESDGYELYYKYKIEEPTDPLSGDFDNDGLTDLFEMGNNTNPYDPDTDNDGLNDRLEVLIGSDPLSVDSDGDGVSDHDEYFVYGSVLTSYDTDLDGLTDGEEVNDFGSSPHLQDSDSDGFLDGEEVDLGTSPLGLDADGDGINDRNEQFIYLTDPFNPDTDGDMLNDYDEIFVYKTSPLDKDTDHDSIVSLTTGEYLFEWNDYQEVMDGTTNPSSSDTDGDGLTDAQELYIGSDQSPYDPISLDPANADTDGDQLEDGDELQITIIEESNSFIVEIAQPFNSSAVLYDTDFDGVDDWTEVMNGTKANHPDSDLDEIGDFDEYYTYPDVSPIEADTDNDGLLDSLELLRKTDDTLVHHPGVNFNNIQNSGLMDVYIDPAIIPPGYTVQNVTLQYYDTYAWEEDSDADLLPDGAELVIYQPNFPDFSPEIGQNDTNSNGIIDGLDLDLDEDGLEDGYEYYGLYPTVEINEWAVFDRDVDHDTLSDGDEVYLYSTRPDWADYDNDTYSDGFEVMVGADPLIFTAKFEMDLILAGLRSPVILVSPRQEVEYTGAIGDLPVVMFNVTALQSSWFRYRRTNESYGSNITLDYSSDTDPGLWYRLDQVFDPGVYILEVFGQTQQGDIYSDIVLFSFNQTISDEDLDQFNQDYLILGITSLGVISIGVVIMQRRRNLI